MCGLARRRRLLSQEAAVKYFLLGAFASAFFLYGLALIYGYAGSVRLTDIADASAGSAAVGLAAVRRVRAARRRPAVQGSVGPFHTWTPDVYQGAPTPVTAFMGACTKVAAFGAILRVLHVAFGATRWEWRGVLWAVAVVSMVIGAVLGLTQTDVKRMVRLLLGGARRLPADRGDGHHPAGRLGHAVLPAGLRVHHARGVRRDQPGARPRTGRPRTCRSGRVWGSGRR